MHGYVDSSSVSSFGALLRGWRTQRRRSQLELALDAEISSRHLSFLETGRSRPSREMVLLLGSALELPLRDRNALLEAAGFIAAYPETPLDVEPLGDIREALVLLLRQHEPFGAVALDAHWNLLLINEGYLRMLRALGGALPPMMPYEVPKTRLNLLRLLFAPDGARRFVGNWDEVARYLMARVQREATARRDAQSQALLEELRALAGIPVRPHEIAAPTSPVLPVELHVGDQVARIFSTIATLGTPQDVTLEELRIEAYHPADAATAALFRALAAADGPAAG